VFFVLVVNFFFKNYILLNISFFKNPRKCLNLDVANLIILIKKRKNPLNHPKILFFLIFQKKEFAKLESEKVALQN